ncbi:Long-chain-fatty-acid--CoA ligase 1 [Halotydeus destructor]|nr:Long-chain-fatty-acid--CoA ligase 1 [Halotydeus destructor]
MELQDFVRYVTSLPLSTTVALVLGTGLVTKYLMNRLKNLPKTQLPVDKDNQSQRVPNEDARKSRIFEANSTEDCMRYLYDDCKTLYDVLHKGLATSADAPCLGRLNKTTKEYEWISYSESMERMRNFGCGLLELGLKEGTETKFGIYASNCVEYLIAEYSCYNHSMTVVPLYDTLGPNACTYIINQAGIECVVVDTQTRFEAIVSEVNNLTTLKHIIVTEDLIESFRSKAIGYGFKVYAIGEVEELGRKFPKNTLRPRPRDLAVICYTSGTTGNPKGAMLTHENIISCVSSVSHQLGNHAPCKTDTYLSFLPLAHMFERCCVAAMFMGGANVGFFGGDIRLLSDDLKALRPTVIPCVPRLFNRIHDKVYTTIKGNKLKEWLLRKALESKQKEIYSNVLRTDSIWDKLVFKNVRQNMGGRLRLVVVGSAPLASNVLDFMRCALGCVICEGYGQTESVCPCTLTLPGDPETGHVGPPLSSCFVKLVDVPEMEYYSRDNSGEVCVKGPIVFQGYFNDPEKTAEVIDNEGWLHTGDIGTWLPNGTLRVIDRKKNIFKLSQGEYIAPEKIEGIYTRSEFVAQIFVYGESLKSHLVAIVVPENDILEAWARQHNIKGTINDLCQEPRVKQAILDDLHKCGKQDGLQSYEQVKDISMHPQQFSIDNGLLTPTLKTKRIECRKFFVNQIEAMYRSID